MSDERSEFQQLGDLSFELWGRVTALDMLMRSLYAKWALEHDDPQAFLDEVHRDLVNGMARQGRDDDPVEALVIHHAEEQLQDTIVNAKLRASLGHRD